MFVVALGVRGICVWSLFCYAEISVLSSVPIILLRKKIVDCLTLILVLLSSGCKCYVSLPRGAVNWSVV